MRGDDTSRGQIQLTDAVLGFFVLAALLALSPIIQQFIGLTTANADPFSQLVFLLVIPSLLIALLLSLGISARRST